MPSRDTEISSPATAAGTSVLAIRPVAGFSTTSAPPAVTATMRGGAATATWAEAIADGEAAALVVARALVPAPADVLLELPPQPASRTRAAATATDLASAGRASTARRASGRARSGMCAPSETGLADGGTCARQRSSEKSEPILAAPGRRGNRLPQNGS